VAGCYALLHCGEGKKRILDPGTLKKIKIPLIDYQFFFGILSKKKFSRLTIGVV
jgi:hypothetical protein